MKQKKKAKNYMILACIYMVVIVLVIYCAKWYQTLMAYQKETPVIRDVLQELDTSEVTHYLLEEPNAILYLCTAEEDKCRSFEQDFRYLVKKRGLEMVITYLNLSKEEQPSAYIELFGKKYGRELDGGSYPMFLQFQDGKIKNVVANLDKKKAEAFLKEHGI